MKSSRNKPTDVFKSIDMHDGDRSVCWEWTGGKAGNGRPSFTLGGKKVTPYRLVYELVHGEDIPDGMVVRHKCDNEICCNPEHLELGTHQQNMDDMKERERHGLPHHVVKAMRKLRSEGKTQEEVAALYGVDRDTVSRIDRGIAYSHVADSDSG